MKRILFSCLLLATIFSQAFSVQPLRDPSILLFVDGELMLDQATIDVNRGDRFNLLAEIEGGRADFVKFPDTYADLGSEAKIRSRGNNQLVYSVNGKEYRWELVNENVEFESDDKIKLEINQKTNNKHLAEVTIPALKIDQTYIKVKITSTWRFTDGNTKKDEVNKAEAVLHLNIIGSENQWFATKNVKASGSKNAALEAKLQNIQNSYQTIENLLSSFDFTSVQVEIRSLQSSMKELETQIQQFSKEDASNRADVLFVGLPSDQAISDIDNFRRINIAWNELELLASESQAKLVELTYSGDKIKKKDLLSLINPFIKWQETLPVNSESLLETYASDVDWHNIKIQNFLSYNPQEERINNIEQVVTDFQTFLKSRTQNIPFEKQKINYALTRLNAVKIFDGMLMGLFSSVNFANWENTRK